MKIQTNNTDIDDSMQFPVTQNNKNDNLLPLSPVIPLDFSFANLNIKDSSARTGFSNSTLHSNQLHPQSANNSNLPKLRVSPSGLSTISAASHSNEDLEDSISDLKQLKELSNLTDFKEELHTRRNSIGLKLGRSFNDTKTKTAVKDKRTSFTSEASTGTGLGSSGVNSQHVAAADTPSSLASPKSNISNNQTKKQSNPKTQGVPPKMYTASSSNSTSVSRNANSIRSKERTHKLDLPHSKACVTSTKSSIAGLERLVIFMFLLNVIPILQLQIAYPGKAMDVLLQYLYLKSSYQRLLGSNLTRRRVALRLENESTCYMLM
jgi:hypothetical protein